jgi:hypothetical protein
MGPGGAPYRTNGLAQWGLACLALAWADGTGVTRLPPQPPGNLNHEATSILEPEVPAGGYRLLSDQDDSGRPLIKNLVETRRPVTDIGVAHAPVEGLGGLTRACAGDLDSQAAPSPGGGLGGGKKGAVCSGAAH